MNGTQMGKRYVDADDTIELLCTKPGEGSLGLGDALLTIKESKPYLLLIKDSNELMMLPEMASSAFGERVAFGSKDGSGITHQELYERAGKAMSIKETNAEHVFSRVQFRSAYIFIRIIMGWPAFVPLNYRLAADEVQALADRISPTVTVTNSDLSALCRAKRE